MRIKRSFMIALCGVCTIALVIGCGGGDSGGDSDSGDGATSVPGAPTAVAATLGATDSSVDVSFTPPADKGGAASLSYRASSVPAGLSATGHGSPIAVPCNGSCAGYTFVVSAVNSLGAGPASGLADVITDFDVVETFREPMTQPYDSVFTGSFTLNSTTRTVSDLAGSLTESMSPFRSGTLTTVPLTHQLSSIADGLGGNGLLVTAFNLNNVNTFDPRSSAIPALFATVDPSGLFAPGGTVFYGFATGGTNPMSGGVGNAYAMIDVDTDNPTGSATAAEVNLLAYADCNAGGMMGSTCMTGTTVAAYGRVGTMNGYPLSQVVTRAVTNPAAVPGAPTAVSATLGNAGNTVLVSFTPPASAGSSPITGYTVSSTGSGMTRFTASGASSPVTVTCPVTMANPTGSCAGFGFRVSAVNAVGAGAPSPVVDVVTAFKVVETFQEPMTQPNDSIFTGTFTLDSTTRTVTNLQGTLTESMTMHGGVYGPPMTTVPLTYQLSAAADGVSANNRLVTTFRLNTVDTFSGGGFDPAGAGGTSAVYFGFPAAWDAAAANAYATIDVNTDDPYATPAQAIIDKLAYADCTAGGMMGAACMTGTTVAGYGHVGSMSGYPVSQVITKQ